jgi:hypothetical protein
MGMTRKLSAKWTLDEKDDMEFHIEDEVYTELAKNIQHSLDQELLYNLCIMKGWFGTSVSYQQLDEVKKWVETNKLGEVRRYDNRIVFQESKDYEWFILRWQ